MKKKTICLHAVDVTFDPTAAIVELEPQDDPYSLSSRIKAAYAITAELERSGLLPSRAGFEAEAKFIEVLEAGAPPSANALHGRIHGGFYAVKTKRPQAGMDNTKLQEQIEKLQEQIEKQQEHDEKQQEQIEKHQERIEKLEKLQEEVAVKWQKIAEATSEIAAAVLKIRRVCDPLSYPE